MTLQPTRPQGRLLSLDVMRGITIAGMILVNNPGFWSTVYAPLLHAEWNGLTPTDLVFPFFMFIMGVSCFASLRKFEFRPSRQLLAKILRRTFRIFLVGILLGWFGLALANWARLDAEQLPFFTHLWRSCAELDHLRILGVLQRLALCYGAASLIGIYVRHRYIPYIIAAGLVVYYLILHLCNGLVPGEGNALCNLDRMLWGESHMYLDRGVEPEGLLSTIPSVCQTLIGFLCGRILFRQGTDNRERMLKLFLIGTSLTFLGLLLAYGCPINKKIWSPTFVMTTCGLASSLLALLIWIIDVKGRGRLFRFFEAFGANPMAIYVFSGILASLADFMTVRSDGTVLKDLLVNGLNRMTGPYFASLLFALIFVGCCWMVAWILYQKRIYIKL
ncbi:acyltransferase family protein [Alistipes dispar]|uniref:acyltransferase family protein n=1 Tax=Alistipes dispar TaxID=2585119 RepID=UPI003A8C0501